MRSWKRKFEDMRVALGMPVDIMPASNGEFFPAPPTAEQKRIMAIQDAKGEEVRAALGMNRRDFVRSAAAYSVGFWAIGQVMPSRFGSYLTREQRLADPYPRPDACELEYPEAQLNNLPGEFIFDVQSHHVDPAGEWRIINPGFHAVFAALWEQSGPLGAYPGISGDGDIRGWGKGGELDPIENLSRYHYLKQLYLDSSTNMTVLSSVPSAPDVQNPLRIAEAAETVGIIKAMAGGTDRSVMHSFVMPNRGSAGTGSSSFGAPAFMKEEFDFMEENAARWSDRIRGWKVYTPWGDVPNSSGWFLDDAVGEPFIDQVRRIGEAYGIPKVIACHKGFALPAFDARASSPRDIGPAARNNPDVTFIVYHSGYDSEHQDAYPGDDKWNSSDRGVNSLVKSLRENRWDASRFVPTGLRHGNVPNVFAEIGATMRSVMNDPDQLAHLLGKLITHVGPQRVVWGTDSLWFGSPQSVIVALRSFELSAEAKELYDLPWGLDGDRFDPTLDAYDASNYLTPHPHVADWPTDGRSHPERSIRNGIFGRNAAVPYQVDPDAQLKAIACDEVQKIREAYIVNEGTPTEVAPGADNTMPGARTKAELERRIASEPFGP